MKTGKMTIPSKKEGYKRWEKSVKTGDLEKSISVKEAENGFVITITKYNWGENYSHEEKIYISSTNPLEKENPKVEDNTDILKAMKEFNELFS